MKRQRKRSRQNKRWEDNIKSGQEWTLPARLGRLKQDQNKKSAQSGVAPAGIKSHKFLFELKKIYFAEIDGVVCNKMDKVENLECLYQGYGILKEEWVLDSQCHSVLGSAVSGES